MLGGNGSIGGTVWCEWQRTYTVPSWHPIMTPSSPEAFEDSDPTISLSQYSRLVGVDSARLLSSTLFLDSVVVSLLLSDDTFEKVMGT